MEPTTEWPTTLDVRALIADGWQPEPFREFVLKIHSRCDLACDYCYMYTMADQSWQSRPKRMSAAIAEQTAIRIGEHVRRHALSEIGLVLHGGRAIAGRTGSHRPPGGRVRNAVGDDVTMHASVQTNGVGLDDSYLALFDRLGIHIGVSLDGTAGAQNRHRRFASGRESHGAVIAGLGRLTEERYRHLFNGLLCVIDLQNDPMATYEALLAFGPPRIDFLLPHGTWESPPPGRGTDEAKAPYADWLTTSIRPSGIAPPGQPTLRGDRARRQAETHAVRWSAWRRRVSESSRQRGDQQVETPKVAFHQAPQTGLHVARDSFDDALLVPEIAARQMGYQALSAQCQDCRIRRVCGGGCSPTDIARALASLTHRFTVLI